jgi:AcrR family transcriptional regulator
VVTAPKTDQPSLRDEHRAATRRRILLAVAELLAEEHPAELSIPAVAARANVSTATLYRYFPSKEALLDDAAAALYGEELGSARFEDLVFDLLRPEAILAPIFRRLLEFRPLVEAQHWSPVGREMRRRRIEGRRAQVAAQLAQQGIDPTTASGQRLQALILLLISSSALLELHDHGGLDAEDAAAVVSWAIGALIEATSSSTTGAG